MSKYYYITTPIYYVNDKPHIGHIYTSLACDILARFKRMDGFNVIFLTGTDEHGQKVEKSAIAKNISPQKFVDEISESFKNLTPLLNLTNDDFIRTTQERHKKSVQHLWQEIAKNGYIYKDNYSGWYAIRDEAFYSEEELIKKNNTFFAPTGTEVEWREEESYFFKLSEFQDRLLEYYDNNQEFIAPRSRFNEVYSFVKSGLKDLSISRSSFSWGITVPGNSNHIIYVWLDALANYLSALGYPDNIDDKFYSFWNNSTHIIGKDIIRFHAVYWTAFLMAAKLPLPKRIFAHGWWLNEGEKISKSLGNVIDPHDIIDKYGLDCVRYFLFKEIPFGNDGDFSREAIKNRINNDLANGYGNLLQRTLSILNKSFNAKIPTNKLNMEQNLFLDNLLRDIEELRKYIDNQEFSKYLEKIWESIRYGNTYINDTAPWNLIKENKMNEAGEILTFIIELLRVISIYLYPFMPDTTLNILNQLGIKWDKTLNSLGVRLKEKHHLNAPVPIFAKILD